MKQSIYTLTAAIFLVLCTACTEADTVLPQAGGGQGTGQGTGSHPDRDALLSVKELGLSLEVISRAAGIVTGGPQHTANNPNPVKRVGIMVTTYRYPIAYYDPAIQIKAFNYDVGTGIWVQDNAITPDFYLGTDEGSAYPFAPADLTPLLKGVPDNGYPSVGGIELKAAQTFRFHDTAPVDPATDVPWDTDQVDYLCKEGEIRVDRWHPSLSFQLNHALVKVSFRVMEKDGKSLYAGSKVVKVELKSDNKFRISKPATPTDPGTVMDIYHGFMYGPSTVPASSLTFTAATGTERAIGSGTTVAAQVPIQAFGLVMPVGSSFNSSSFQATAELTLDDGHVFKSEAFTVDWGHDLANGSQKHYIYTLRLDPKGIVIGKPAVVGWNQTVEQSVPVD